MASRDYLQTGEAATPAPRDGHEGEEAAAESEFPDSTIPGVDRGDAATAAESEEAPPRGYRLLREIREWARVVVYVLAFYFALTALLVEGYYIPSCSMEPTLFGARETALEDGSVEKSVGDRIIALKGVYTLGQPQRGDIIIFESTEDGAEDGTGGTLLVKRVVGLPGEEVEIRDYWVYVRAPGETQFHPIPRDAFPEDQEYDNRGRYGASGLPCKVPDDHYFVLGDNTWNSNDSRIWGFVPRSHIKGRAILRFWPLSRLGMVH